MSDQPDTRDEQIVNLREALGVALGWWELVSRVEAGVNLETAEGNRMAQAYQACRAVMRSGE